MFKKLITDYVMKRFKEPSTWRGIILLVAGSIGFHLSAGQTDALVPVALAIVGAIGAFTPDKVGPAQIPAIVTIQPTPTVSTSAEQKEDPKNEAIKNITGG